MTAASKERRKGGDAKKERKGCPPIRSPDPVVTSQKKEGKKGTHKERKGKRGGGGGKGLANYLSPSPTSISRFGNTEKRGRELKKERRRIINESPPVQSRLTPYAMD